MAEVTIELDTPEGVEICGYERHGDGHAFEVRWRWPERCVCGQCGQEEAARITLKNTVYVVRDLELWGQPSFWAYVPPVHACSRCGHRQHVPPPFKRKDVSYTDRFEEAVLRSLIGSTEEDVARRWGISAETVALIVRNQLGAANAVDPQRTITDVGLDEISLKKRHKQYVTILTDWTDPEHPRVLAVAEGRDQAAAEACLNQLSPEQRQQVRTHRTDMSPAYAAACGNLLPKSQQVIDRFHVAKRLGEAAETVRKKKTRAYKKTLSKEAQKEFSSLMWECRRRPDYEDEETQAKLEALFERLPAVGFAVSFRWTITEVFDTAEDREDAEIQLAQWRELLTEDDAEFQKFFAMYDRWKDGILAYFDRRQTSGPVEGVNNKARVITRRAYGLKSAAAVWTRLHLDLNRAADAVVHTVRQMRALAQAIQSKFASYYT